jgi:hypothetical protein
MSVITKFTLASPLLTVDLPVADAKPTDRYILRGVDGLGPPEINISMGDSLYQGGIYRGSQPMDREIVIKLSLNPTYSGEVVSTDQLRAELYSNMAGQFSSRFSIFSREYADGVGFLPPEMYTDGYVKRIEIAPFEKDSVVQVVLRCPGAWFQESEASTIDPIPASFYYSGSASTGFVYHFSIAQDATKLNIQTESFAPEYEILQLIYAFHAGDIIEFDSRPGSRSVKLLRSPNLDSIDITGYSMIENNIWPSLRPGSNTIRVYENTWDDPITKTDLVFYFTRQYWGV